MTDEETENELQGQVAGVLSRVAYAVELASVDTVWNVKKDREKVARHMRQQVVAALMDALIVLPKEQQIALAEKLSTINK